MTVRGTVNFDVPQHAALHAALWILVYGPFDRAASDWGRTEALGNRLLDYWDRKGRSRLVTLTLSRDEASWLDTNLVRTGVGSIIGSGDVIRDDAHTVGAEAWRRLRRRRGSGLRRPCHSTS